MPIGKRALQFPTGNCSFFGDDDGGGGGGGGSRRDVESKNCENITDNHQTNENYILS